MTTAVRYAIPDGDAVELDLAARLESWNARDHRDQVALRRWVAHVHAQIAPFEGDIAGELALRLDVGLPDVDDPLWQLDLDNYLYPVARGLSPRYVSIWGTKGRAASSAIRVEAARRVAGDPDGAARFAVPRAARAERVWKHAVADAVAVGRELPAGPVALEIALALPGDVRWAEMWKRTIDGLGAILGSSRGGSPWNPHDGRVTRLGLHRTAAASGRDAEATIWARPAPLEWEENAWLESLDAEQRASFLAAHRARVQRSERMPRGATRPAHVAAPRQAHQFVSESGVTVFLDDDAGYERWMAATPAGFVVNALRRPTSGDPVLHRATCWTLSHPQLKGGGWTTRDYVKACATDRIALARWVRANGAVDPRACGTCAP
jgi:hypothetical protein